MTAQRTAALLLTLAMLVWAGNILLGRAMHAAFTPTALSFWRWLAVAALLLPVTAPGLWRKRAVLRREWKVLCVQGFLAVTAFNWLLYQAVQTTTATNAALIYTNVPVFIVVVMWAAFGERIRARQAVGIAVSMGGVAAIITRGDPVALLAWDFTPGDLWALATVPVWGLYTISLRRRPAELSPLEFLAALVVLGMVVLTPAFLFEHSLGVRVVWDWRTLGTIAYLAVMASIVAFVLWNAGVPHLGANRAGLFTHLYPLFTAVLAVIFLGEALHPYHAVGALMIFGGLYLTTVVSEAAPLPAPPREGPAAEAAGGTAARAAAPRARGSLLRLLASPQLLLVLNMVFWSGNWIIGRGLRGDVTALGLNFWRWALALAWLLPFTWPEIWRERRVIARDWKVLVALGVLGVGLFNLMVYLAVARTTATNAALINSSQPVVIALLAWMLFRDRLTARQTVGVGVSLLGVLVIISRADPALLLQLRFNTGDLIGLAAVPIWSLYSVLLRKRPPELSPMALLTVLMIVGVTALLPFSLWAHAQEAQVALGVNTAAGLIYVALFPSLLGVAFYNYGVAQLGASVAGLFLHLIPPFTAGLAWLLLGEALQAYHLIGAALIFTGIYVSTVAGGRARPVQPDADQID